MGDTPKFHPALTINNIRNFIPITLELENGKYSSWAELFKIHCTAFQVLNHIFPPPESVLSSGASTSDSPAASGKDKETATSSSSTSQESARTDPTLFARLDAIVLQWIYGTISSDLLHTILQPNSSAASAWARLRNIFQDNKKSRAVYPESQFTQLRLENFNSVSAYCQELKLLADQLANVDAPVSEDRLVLQLISGLSDAYDTVATLLQKISPLPSFYEARSRLILEESRKSRQAALTSSSSAMVTTETTDSPSSKSVQTGARQTADAHRAQGSPSSRKQTGRGRGTRGRGRGRFSAHYQPRAWAHQPMWPAQQQLPGWPSHPWAFPPRPHALSAQFSNSFAPTDFDQAMQAMSLHAPDTQWYMDTGASSHMTSSAGHSDKDTHSQM